MHAECLHVLNLDLPIKSWSEEEGIADAEIRERILEQLQRKMEGKERNYGQELMRVAEKSILLRVLDQVWKEHLLELDHLRQGINLRAYAQRDPLNEYKQEAFLLFKGMLAKVREQTIQALSHLELREQTSEKIKQAAFEDAEVSANRLQFQSGDFQQQGKNNSEKSSESDQNMTGNSTDSPTNRNALCACGSGKRFKHCHGKFS